MPYYMYFKSAPECLLEAANKGSGSDIFLADQILIIVTNF